MSSEPTQHQSADELKKARDLSLESNRPPSQIPGYKLRKFIGSGAYGEVWSATDLKTGRQVAVKFYTRRSQADVQLLAQEVQKLVVLSNDSYVVGLLDVGWDASPPYYVMDYIESGSLEDRLKQGRTLPTSAAVALFQEIATGMVLLHGKGILHCDLKPGNVLLDQNGKPRVADFGQARLSTDETPALGTLFYMAPEQADLTAIPDAGWDVYGLGALLFSMLTGQPPYYSRDVAKAIEAKDDIQERLETYRATLMAAPTPTEHRLVSGVDRGLADIIDRCIAADPGKRFTNVQSVLLALRQRDLVRARRPLMLLGLIGPVLLMTVMSMFGWWAFGQAMNDAEAAVLNKAKESNDYAAKLAARSAAEQVEDYFRVVGQLARDPSFLDMFDEIMADDELRKLRIQLADPNRNSIDGVEQDPQAGAIRDALKAHELRQELQKVFLEPRMRDVENEYPVADSWFISDRYGNQIASDFGDEENRTLGCNYSYRTYFTGGDRDLELDDPLISHEILDHESLLSRPILSKNKLHNLSAVFQSKQSKTWKVAFSAPIIRYNEVQGIVAVTVNLEHLIEFDNTAMQYVMLVDSREGRQPSGGRPDRRTGTILQHPLFAEVLKQQAQQSGSESTRLPESLATAVVELSDDQFHFVDPLGSTEQGKQSGYGQESIVSRVDVMAPGLEAEGKTTKTITGLEVLAVQDYKNILSDVTTLGDQLWRLASVAGLVVLCLFLGMLLFVNRMLRESRERLAGSVSPTVDPTTLQSMETIAVVSKPPNGKSNLPTDGPSNPTDLLS